MTSTPDSLSPYYLNIFALKTSIGYLLMKLDCQTGKHWMDNQTDIWMDNCMDNINQTDNCTDDLMDNWRDNQTDR